MNRRLPDEVRAAKPPLDLSWPWASVSAGAESLNVAALLRNGFFRIEGVRLESAPTVKELGELLKSADSVGGGGGRADAAPATLSSLRVLRLHCAMSSEGVKALAEVLRPEPVVSSLEGHRLRAAVSSQFWPATGHPSPPHD